MTNNHDERLELAFWAVIDKSHSLKEASEKFMVSVGDIEAFRVKNKDRLLALD
jgi:hypothetical protein